ncbi:AP2 domain-containing protein [Cryptosporidium andersoni]|uniref:AP2 domain-containing protein n=1 Tax=Cryptosporidium andersoni TaxID=117008 RepID=A0A1J4MSL9_9CRYT|nr:AP2 domain-containing protein [Cryptosporidium andersoni]
MTVVNQGEVDDLVRYLYSECHLDKSTYQDIVDIHSITPSLIYLIHKYGDNNSNGHTIISNYSSLLLQGDQSSVNQKVCSRVILPYLDRLQELPRGSLLLYGETACYVAAYILSNLKNGQFKDNLRLFCSGRYNNFTCNIKQVMDYIEASHIFILNPYLTEQDIRELVEFQSNTKTKLLVSCRPDLLDLGLANFKLNTKSPSFILTLRNNTKSAEGYGASPRGVIPIPIYLYSRIPSISIQENKGNIKSHEQQQQHYSSVFSFDYNCYIGDDLRVVICVLSSLYRWFREISINIGDKSSHIQNASLFDDEVDKYYPNRARDLLANIEYIIKSLKHISDARIGDMSFTSNLTAPINNDSSNTNTRKGISTGLVNCTNNDSSLDIGPHSGVINFTTPNSRCSISTTASTTPVSIGNDLIKGELSQVSISQSQKAADLEHNVNSVGLANRLSITNSVRCSSSSVVCSRTMSPSNERVHKDYKITNGNVRNSVKNGVNRMGTPSCLGQSTISNSTPVVSTLIPGTIVRFRSQIPVDAKLIPGVPETDYFTHVQQVYYHFQKGEWRAVYGPSKNRQQKSFSVNKYGFYEAKRLAEEWRLRYLYSHPNTCTNISGVNSTNTVITPNSNNSSKRVSKGNLSQNSQLNKITSNNIAGNLDTSNQSSTRVSKRRKVSSTNEGRIVTSGLVSEMAIRSMGGLRVDEDILNRANELVKLNSSNDYNNISQSICQNKANITNSSTLSSSYANDTNISPQNEKTSEHSILHPSIIGCNNFVRYNIKDGSNHEDYKINNGRNTPDNSKSGSVFQNVNHDNSDISVRETTIHDFDDHQLLTHPVLDPLMLHYTANEPNSPMVQNNGNISESHMCKNKNNGTDNSLVDDEVPLSPTGKTHATNKLKINIGSSVRPPNNTSSYHSSPYTDHFSNISTTETNYTCVSPVVEDSCCWHNSNDNNNTNEVDINNVGNTWLKRSAWDEDLLIDSFFVG